MKANGLRFLMMTAGLLSCADGNDKTHPYTRPLIEAVYASGYIVAKNEYQVIAMVDGYVAAKIANDGDDVVKGDPIYIIDSDQQSARHRIAQETFELARRNAGESSPVLSELRTAVSGARTKMLFDSTNFVRFENLLRRNATTQAEYDRARLLYESASNDYRLARSRYQRTYDQLSLELKNATNNLTISATEAGRYIIRSEVSGRVFLTSKEKGELIRRGETVAIVGESNAFYLHLNVDEEDVGRIRSGQEVLVKVDAFPDTVFAGRISRIYPLVDRRQQSVRVDAELSQEFPAGFSGLALEANIIIRKKEQAVVIPSSYLMPGDTVFVDTSDGVKRIKVNTGIRTLDEVEITHGLDTSSIILMNDK